MSKYVLTKMFSHRGAYALTAVMLISFVLQAALPGFNGLFVDMLVYSSNVTQVIQFAIIVAAIGIFSAVLSYVSNIISIRITNETMFSVLSEHVAKIEHANLADVESLETGYAAQRIFADSNAVTSFVISNFLLVWLEGLLAIGILCIFLRIDVTFIPLSAMFVTAYVVLFIKLQFPLYRTSMEKKEADSTFFNDISCRIDYTFETQLRCDYEKSVAGLRKAFGQFLPKTIQAGKVRYLFTSADGLISVIFQAIILFVAGIKIVNGTMTIGELTMANAYFAMLLQTVKYYMGMYQQYQDARASYKRLATIAITPSPYQRHDLPRTQSLDSIKLCELTYHVKQGDETRELYGGLSHPFARKTSYAIVGGNGTGKSTLLKLLAGLYDSHGCVLYNETPLECIDVEDTRRNHMSVVPQFLRHSTMRTEDFILEQTGITKEELRELLTKRDNLPTITACIPDLLDKSSNSLSGGEARKLHLWMAITEHKDVLILDEPTAGLDAAGKKDLVDYLKRNPYKQMIIVMTHDQTIAQTAQNVLTLRET